MKYDFFVQVSLEDGTVKGFDIRNATTESSSESKASFTLHAHEKAVCSVSYSPSAPNVFAFLFSCLCCQLGLITNFCLSLTLLQLLATGSTDKMVLHNNPPLYCACK